MFDPFGDFETAGYLRNVRKDKDQRDIKRFEHDLFEANFDVALDHLAACGEVTYDDFLAVHRILFSDYYPWAGQDRAVTMPNNAVRKGDVLFSHPNSARLAMEHGLRMGHDPVLMATKPGEVMGLFAYGHPFLDGNGRTMLLVHMELCHRAGFSIDWQKTIKTDYLFALSREIDSPGVGVLDGYLLKFKGPKAARGEWGSNILTINGLNGSNKDNQVDGDLSDPITAEKYHRHEQKRGYSYAAVQTLALQLNAAPGKRQATGRIVALSDMEVIQDAGRGKLVAWDRRSLENSGALTVGMCATIYESGRINYPRTSKSLGR